MESRHIDEDESQIGIATRAVSWLLDAAVINLVAIAVGLGVELILSIFPVSPNLSSVFKPIAGAVYAIWLAAYFIAFWSVTGQTPGARVMQIRLVTASGKRLKPGRALLRWIGMNLAMVPLFAGYVPILFGRRGFPDWLARTLVLDATQVSLAQARREAKRAARRAVDDGLPSAARRSRPGSAGAEAPVMGAPTDGSHRSAETPNDLATPSRLREPLDPGLSLGRSA